MEKIKLVVAGTEIIFEPNQTAYNKFINEMSVDNKDAPANNYIKRIVAAEGKEAMGVIIKVPGDELQLE
ncbi:hypothetical protein CDT92_21950, partial [Cronobacter sakazakii]|uniref:putative phage tail assembly chaperone n=1 Tax=Cronobacter sakazakii TaxID=28141 RepID=UPI000BE97513